MKIKSFIGGFDKNLSYIVWCNSSRKALLIDAATEVNEILEFIETKQLFLEKLLITHTHNDHIKYLNDIIYQFPNIQIHGYINPEKQINNYKGLEHNEIIIVGSEIFIVLHTPGHYPDSICFWNQKHNCVFTGDTIFVGRTGRTIGIKSNISQLYNSVYKKILTLPQNTIIYPGHHYGYKKTITIKENISLSPFFQCTSENDFINVMNNFEKNR